MPGPKDIDGSASLPTFYGKELRWNRASQEVKSIIALVKSTLEQNDATAQSTMARAKSAVDNIG